jgi:hypothetical protein
MIPRRPSARRRAELPERRVARGRRWCRRVAGPPSCSSSRPSKMSRGSRHEFPPSFCSSSTPPSSSRSSFPGGVLRRSSVGLILRTESPCAMGDVTTAKTIIDTTMMLTIFAIDASAGRLISALDMRRNAEMMFAMVTNVAAIAGLLACPARVDAHGPVLAVARGGLDAWLNDGDVYVNRLVVIDPAMLLPDSE